MIYLSLAMKRRNNISLIVLLASLLSSCGQNQNNPHILKNGDLEYIDEINDDNAFINGTYSYLEMMLEANESFIFYLMQDECIGCKDFKDKMLSFIQSTHSLVVRMNITNNDEFEEFTNKYHDQFFYKNVITTPQVYVVSNKESVIAVPSSRYSTATMFKGAMNDYIYNSNVYTFSTYQSYANFLEKEDDLLTIIVDYTKKETIELYKSVIEQKIKATSKKVALIQILSEDSEFLTKLEITDSTYPLGIRKATNERVTFKVNDENCKQFLDTYL